MRDQKADSLERLQALQYTFAGLRIKVVRRLIEHEHIGTLPERASDLSTLLLAARKALIVPQPRIFDAERIADLQRLASPIGCKIAKLSGYDRGVLWAICSEQHRGDRPLIGHDQPGCNASERALTAAVVADDTRPTLRKRHAHAIERRRRSTFVGVGDI